MRVWLNISYIYLWVSIAHILRIERPFQSETNARCDVKWLQRFCVFYGNKTYTPKWQKHSVADTHRSMHSFSCVYEKHFLNTFYMRPKRRTLTQKERVPARIWRNPACSFHTWIHISLVWFGISCVSSSFQIHQQIEITGNVWQCEWNTATMAK